MGDSLDYTGMNEYNIATTAKATADCDYFYLLLIFETHFIGYTLSNAVKASDCIG